MLIKLFKAIIPVVVLFAAGTQAGTIAELEDARPGDLQVIGFTLPSETEVEIDAVGVRTRWSDEYFSYSWLLNADTREPIWSMGDAREERVNRNRVLWGATETVTLPAGKYELYQFTHDYRDGSVIINGFRGVINAIGNMFDDDWERDVRRAVRDAYVKVDAADLSESDIEYFEATGEIPDAVLEMTGIIDDEMVSKGISLDRPMDLRIYAIYEHPDSYDRPVDHAWIIDAKTRKLVWELEDRHAGWAGGGEKNRIYDEQVPFEAGDYIVFFASDGSHSWEAFNVNPPFDPMNWGVAILPGDDFDKSAFSLFVPAERNKPIIELTRARDDRLYEQAFKVEKPLTVNVVALGEHASGDDRFADYGWIEDAGTGKIVWEMTPRNTVPAGGASKNRMFDGIVELDAGQYIVRYVTDGSHAYRSWNSDPPYDASAWGISLYIVNESDASAIAEIDLDEIDQAAGVLARLTRVTDNEFLRKEFKLDEPTDVHIYAIGEGSRGEMYDFAWIENRDTRRIVWEMTYRNTYRAGGAKKNRMYDDVIRLDPGEYVVFYETDGSHSFNDWNAERPDDPMGWGVTVRLANK